MSNTRKSNDWFIEHRGDNFNFVCNFIPDRLELFAWQRFSGQYRNNEKKCTGDGSGSNLLEDFWKNLNIALGRPVTYVGLLVRNSNLFLTMERGCLPLDHSRSRTAPALV
jgi:hypothetical protein